MEPTSTSPQEPAAVPPAAPVILVAALLQGLALYALHRAILLHHWPVTQPEWLLGLYAVAAFTPTSIQLLADHIRRRTSWVMLSVLSAAFFGFGWQHGATALEATRPANPGSLFPLAFVMLVWWQLVLPFLQNQLATGHWMPDYRQLFQWSWRNIIMLAEAALFTGLFWLILELWQALFSMLGFGFFSRLFQKPEFTYPVTALAFGGALHLVGSVQALISSALGQLLNLLKWLACLATVLLTAFTSALLLSVPRLMLEGRHAVSATWLLWLLAVMVLLLNAAYRDGTTGLPYPRWIALAIRACVPLTVLIGVTALYALLVRIGHDGLTVDRVWALVVATALLLYCAGYAVAALRRGPWLSAMAPVNVVVALALIVTLGACLTPVLSPYRLSADSQYRLILADRGRSPRAYDSGESRFHDLRFSDGAYGRGRLTQLTHLTDHPRAALIRSRASAALALHGSWEEAPAEPDAATLLAGLSVYPQGRVLDQVLQERVLADWRASGIRDASRMSGLFVDLDGDGMEEFVLFGSYWGTVYQRRALRWEITGRMSDVGTWNVLRDDLAAGRLAVEPPHWQELVIGRQRMHVQPPPD